MSSYAWHMNSKTKKSPPTFLFFLLNWYTIVQWLLPQLTPENWSLAGTPCSMKFIKSTEMYKTFHDNEFYIFDSPFFSCVFRLKKKYYKVCYILKLMTSITSKKHIPFLMLQPSGKNIYCFECFLSSFFPFSTILLVAIMVKSPLQKPYWFFIA